MRTKLSLALSAVLAAFLFAGAATAAPGHGSTMDRLIPDAGIQRDLVTNVKFAYSKKKKSRKFTFSKKKKRGKFTFSKRKKPRKFAFPKKKKPGVFAFSKKKFAFSKKRNPRVFAPPKKKKGDNGGNGGNSQPTSPTYEELLEEAGYEGNGTPPTYEELLEEAGYDGNGDNGGNGGNSQSTPPTYEELLEAAGYDGSGTPPTYEELLEAAGYDSALIGNGGNGGDNDDKDHDTNGHHHGSPGPSVGLGFGYNVTEAAPAVPYAADPRACMVPTAAQPTLLDQVVARLVLLNELNRQGVIKDDDYEIQKTVVLLSMAQEVGVADALQVIKCIEERELIGDNEYDAKRKELVAIQ